VITKEQERQIMYKVHHVCVACNASFMRHEPNDDISAWCDKYDLRCHSANCKKKREDSNA